MNTNRQRCSIEVKSFTYMQHLMLTLQTNPIAKRLKSQKYSLIREKFHRMLQELRTTLKVTNEKYFYTKRCEVYEHSAFTISAFNKVIKRLHQTRDALQNFLYFYRIFTLLYFVLTSNVFCIFKIFVDKLKFCFKNYYYFYTYPDKC